MEHYVGLDVSLKLTASIRQEGSSAKGLLHPTRRQPPF
jgi:hypothetical protein